VATIEDLENKVREVAAKVEGEKQVTRRLYEQALRNSDQIGTRRLEVGTVITQNEQVVGRDRPDHVGAAQPWRPA
jgi:hypothetical protein